MMTEQQKRDELNDGLTAARIDEVTLHIFRDKRWVYPLWGGSFEADCWCAEKVDPNDKRPVFEKGDTPGEAADALLGKLYPPPADDDDEGDDQADDETNQEFRTESEI
jgi:hypothetical protein